MPLQFIIGPAGCGKSHYLYQEIIRRASLERSRNFIVIVPEQYTMQTQEEILRLTESHGMINIDVLSFRRLAHRIFAETGGPARQPMEEIGKSFVLEKLALKHKKDLPLLGRGLTRSGNLAEMKSVISEFLEYGVDSTALDKARPDDRSLFASKMREITLLYSAFEDYLRDHSAMTAEEMPGVLGEAVGTSQLLRGATLAFDGFTGFTPVQLTLVGRLMAVSGDIYAALTMDTEDNPLAALAPTALFSMSHEMAREMKTCADTAKIPFLPPIRLGRGGEPRRDGGHPATPAAPASRSAAAQGLPAAASGRFSRSRELAHLEANLFRRRRTVYGGKTEDIICFAAQTPREETEEAARRILRLVRTEGLRFRDIALITGDLPGYGKYIRQVFSSLDIPYFMDEKRDILRNPFVEYLRSAVSIAAEDFPEEAVTRFIRSGFSGISEEEADRLENYLLGSGIRGRRRYREVWTYLYRGQDPAEMTAINACREKLTASLIPFAEAFARRGSTVREKTEALYRLLAASGAEQTLATDAARFESQGNMALGREYRQIYVRIMQLLERLVDVLGDEKISIRDYRDVLESGLKEERIGIIPPGSDQVRVGDMERSRIGGIRVLFFLGLNDGIVPKRKENASLLTEQDRETLASAKIRLKAGPREELAASRYYTYLALTRPSERLYLSYAGGNADGSPLRPSYLIRTIKELFPSLSEEGCAETFSERLEHPEHGIDMLSEAFGVLRSERPRSYHYELYRSLLMRKESARRVKILREAACVEPRRDQISKKAARALYGMRLMNSASRLERFSGCEFAHFLQYGLRLAEREVYSFSPMDTGNILHASLETFARALRDQGRTWQSLTEEERAELSAKCVREAALGYKGELMISSAENAFEIDRMARLMDKTVWAMTEQLKRGDFEPASFELGFGEDGSLASMNYHLPDGTELVLTGRIDRLDVAEDADTLYLKIMDYKTGSRSFDMAEVYYGLQLQLVLYMSAALELFGRSGKVVKPAGIFYYEVKDPVEKLDGEMGDEELKAKILTDMKGSGYVAAEKEIHGHFDHALLHGASKSDVIQVSYKKGGELAATSKVLTEDQFATLLSFTRKKVISIGERIMKGCAAINPYQLRDRTACDYCPFRGICGFDVRLGYKTRRLTQARTDEVLAKMEEELSED